MPISKEKSEELKKIVAALSISVAALLCLAKAVAVYSTSSLAVLSSMVDSLSDVVASVVTFFAVKVSVRPASNKYRYGYGKAEALSALFQAMFVAASGGFIIYDAVLRLAKPTVLHQTDFGLAVMVFSLAITLVLVWFQQYVARRTSSQAIAADSMHYVVDILTNSSIILSLLIIKFWQIYWIDTVAAGIIAVYLLYMSYDAGKNAVSLLLDKELGEDIRQDVLNIVARHKIRPLVHDLRTRDLGNGYMFEFHLELDGDLSLKKAHDYTQEIEDMIYEKYPSAQVVVHQDPIGIEEHRLDSNLKN